MIGKAHLSTQHDIISERATSGNACLTGDQAMPANHHVVADLDEIVDLGPLSDHGVATGAAVDGGTGTNLHLVLHDHPADLWDLEMLRLPGHVAESILADMNTGMDDDAIADQGVEHG